MSPASQSFRFRESRRLLREVVVRLTASGQDGELSGLTRDIATGGMFVSTPTPMPVGTSAHFVLQLGSDDEPADVEGEATVVWVRPEAGGADQPAGMGMRFSRVEPPGEERLALLFSEPQGESDVIPPAAAPEAEEVEVQEAATRDVEAEAGAEAVEDEAPTQAPDAIEPVEIVEAEATDAVEPAEIVDAEPVPAEEPAESPPEPARGPVGDDSPSIDQPLAGEDAAGAGEVEPTHAELFGDLAKDDEDWMKPESTARPWLWPAVGGAVLLVALIAFRGPLMNLVGLGGAPAEEAAPAEAPSFEISTPRAGAETPPAGAAESSTASPLPVAIEEPAADPEAPAEGEADEPVRVAATQDAGPVAAERPAPVPAAVEVETRPAPAAEPAAARRPPAPPAPPPANATALRSITASTAGDRTVIEIVGNAPFQRHHIMPLESPPRLVVRLIGVRQGYDASAVRGPRLRGVRTGVHGRGATRNLHVVLDLTASDIAATVERRGDRVVVNLSD
ncbi:MAG: PilZ domain-containing protein [Acidobacteria bacterium]|nr:PilZ domain-containing protein [Acidobacteriota bacterium]